MKRRSFIRSAAVSAIGVGILPADLLSSPLVYPSASAMQWLQQIGIALAAKRRSGAAVAPEAFAQLKDTTDAYYAERGYHKVNDNAYFLNGPGDCCFYPLVFSHAASGITDIVLPVFRLDGNKQWKLINTLSGFQVEVLARAASKLADHSPTALQNMLFPVAPSSMKGKYHIYQTAQGSVSISTQLKNGQAETACTIQGNAGKMYEATFTSKHCLQA